MKLATLALSLLLFLSASANAETTFQLGIPGANVPNDPAVNGVRFSFLWGKNQSTDGLDLGLLSLSETSKQSGLVLCLGINKVTGEMDSGAAFSLINWHTGKDSGMNGAFINLLNDTSDAFNLGFVTIAKGETGVDLGGFNMSNKSLAQIGFINVTEEIKSFQFGFINIAKNGFLPVFPIFNFPKSAAD